MATVWLQFLFVHSEEFDAICGFRFDLFSVVVDIIRLVVLVFGISDRQMKWKREAGVLQHRAGREESRLVWIQFSLFLTIFFSAEAPMKKRLEDKLLANYPKSIPRNNNKDPLDVFVDLYLYQLISVVSGSQREIQLSSAV